MTMDWETIPLLDLQLKPFSKIENSYNLHPLDTAFIADNLIS